MEFHGGLGHQFLWNSMEISPWRIRTFSMEFHGKGCHGISCRIRNPVCMEISPSIFSVEDLDIFHGIPQKNSMQFHSNHSIDYSMDLQGVSWNSQALNGIHNRFWSTAVYWIISIFIINLF